MTIIEHGLMNNDKIIIKCPSCYCIYSVDDRNDWDGEWLINNSFHPLEKKNVYSYECSCPECGYKYHFGCNPTEGLPRLSNPQPIFQRKDWDEKYSISK